jgi:hypothetical protein
MKADMTFAIPTCLAMLLLASVLPAQAAPGDRDSDGDGLPDFQELHKYLTDPAKKDTDGDGAPDGDWNERRESAYTVRTVLRVMRPAEVEAMTDDFQDARLVRDHGAWIEAEVIHYPLGTAAHAITSNPRWSQEAAAMRPWLGSTATSNWDEKMRATLMKGVEDYSSLDDRAVVERAAPWLLRHARYEDGFTTFYTSFDGARPFVTADVRAEVEKECRTSGRKLEDQWNRELFAKGMFENATRGSCTSTAIYLTGCLRALGVPTRIVLCIPCIDANDPGEIEMVSRNVKHDQVRRAILEGIEGGAGKWTSHTFNEVWVGGRWRRLNGERLSQPILDARCMGLMTHVATLRDWADGNAAATIGKRQATKDWKDVFGGPNPYSTVLIEDLFGARSKIPNPRVEELAALTIESVAWADDESVPEGLREPRGDSPERLLARVKDGVDFDVIKAFTQKADRRFLLEADGHPTLSVEARVGGATHPNGMRWVVIGLGPADRAALARGVSYSLRPRNDESAHKWVVAEGLRVVRK